MHRAQRGYGRGDTERQAVGVGREGTGDHYRAAPRGDPRPQGDRELQAPQRRSEEHTSELQSLAYLVCRLLLEKKKKKKIYLIYLMKSVIHRTHILVGA